MSEVEPQNLSKEACLHRWVIETPNGATSKGHCKSCGIVRFFPNALVFEDGSDASYRSMRAYSSRYTRAQGAPIDSSEQSGISLGEDI